MNPISPTCFSRHLPIQGLGKLEMPNDPAAFKDMLIDCVSKLNVSAANTDQTASSLAGGAINPTNVLAPSRQADMTVHVMMQIQDQLVSAYHEVQDIRV